MFAACPFVVAALLEMPTDMSPKKNALETLCPSFAMVVRMLVRVLGSSW